MTAHETGLYTLTSHWCQQAFCFVKIPLLSLIMCDDLLAWNTSGWRGGIGYTEMVFLCFFFVLIREYQDAKGQRYQTQGIGVEFGVSAQQQATRSEGVLQMLHTIIVQNTANNIILKRSCSSDDPLILSLSRSSACHVYLLQNRAVLFL